MGEAVLIAFTGRAGFWMEAADNKQASQCGYVSGERFQTLRLQAHVGAPKLWRQLLESQASKHVAQRRAAASLPTTRRKVHKKGMCRR